jgi:glyoxalase family protein
MTETVNGLHHVTAIAGDPQRNLDFYAGALGLRFVKKTVNFDDPGSYHLYYGDETGAPGSAMTFFPWARAPRGVVGAGQVALTQFAAPSGALPFWIARLRGRGAAPVAEETAFGERRAVFHDPDGLPFAIVETDDPRRPWTTPEIGAEAALRGFRGVTLALHDGVGAERVLTEVFGYRRLAETALGGGRLIRLALNGAPAGVVDLHVDTSLRPGREGVGVVHHVAFSVPDRAAQARIRARLAEAGLRVTEQIDRDYFWAIYARVPGGVLFEVATDEPGFTRDEPVGRLGESLRLPAQHAHLRARIEAALPVLVPPSGATAEH